ncbi:IucA/IucC family protein [Gordonia soli]|uniref:Putative siderophore biosynthesis protein n=1 Tax=Gordonia soli NBRC 108243 TaxID=1223545 RepID=M0QQH8_9ACTN|nr:IucA/IucC family siderophore biosynthesis protein [Gordonia soli]GAC70654.1 putative siderophore biosynthesis protein [Gordonia soli NBRC 108243]
MTDSIETPVIARSYREVYDRRIAQKIIAEFCHEQAIHPIGSASGEYSVLSDDQLTEYTFSAEQLSLDSWVIDETSLRRTKDGIELPVRAIDLVIDLREQLGIPIEALPEYLEELVNTLALSADRPDSRRIAAADLAASDFQTIERTMTEGHPCFVANAGRLGFSVDDIERYAPESGGRFHLVWVAAWRADCDFAAMTGVTEDDLLRDELGAETLDRFAGVLSDLGLDPADYCYLPVHPWQWTEKVAKLYASDLAERRLVLLGEGPDLYQPQQSIRSMFNVADPSRHYVKTALSIVNMGFTRGMSADYMRTTPLINDWVSRRVGGDEYLRSLGFEMLFEVAAIGYRNPLFNSITQPGSEYRKLLSALWRQSPVPRISDHEQLSTMAALLHVDHHGVPLVEAFIERSGLAADEWVRRYLRTYLHPITYLLYRYELKFSPHGENLILVLDSGVPVRAILKDIGEEVCIFDRPADLPDSCRRALTEEPDAIRNLGVLSDVFDDFLRPLAALLHSARVLDDTSFWTVVGESMREFVNEHPDLADQFARWDLFAPTYGAVHMNRLQMSNNRRMVNVGDSYSSIIDDDHRLTNPIADFRPGTS